MTLAALFLVAGLTAADPPQPTPRPRDAAAEELIRLCLPLGIDFDRANPDAPHPSKADTEARNGAGYAGWLDAQVQAGDETIAAPPKAFQDYLESRKESLWNVVARLEKQPPEWASARWQFLRPELLPIVSLERLLLAAALIEQRDGRPYEAGRLLDAAWSLGSSVASGSDLLSQLIAVGISKSQAGVLRKIQEPPFQWLDRLSGDSPWTAMLAAIAGEGRWRDPANLVSPGEAEEARARAWAAAAEVPRSISPCELVKMTDAEMWRPTAEELRTTGGAEGKFAAEMLEMAAESLSSSIRRTARLLVDRELTLMVVELRLERAASKDGHWPKAPPERSSSVCPGSSYSYESDGETMSLRFDGEVDDPKAGVSLPLAFKSAAPPTPTPTVTPSPTPPPLTPTPSGGMIGAR